MVTMLMMFDFVGLGVGMVVADADDAGLGRRVEWQQPRLMPMMLGLQRRVGCEQPRLMRMMLGQSGAESVPS